MTTSIVPVSRYSRDDFDATSIRSAAPSYTSEVPSYHTTDFYPEPIPPYTPPARNTNRASSSITAARRQQISSSTARTQTIGLPPVPAAPLVGTPTLHNFRIPTWSTQNAPSSRQIRSVIERRVNERSNGVSSSVTTSSSSRLRAAALERNMVNIRDEIVRPLEDPYLVGEQAAAQARRERVLRETGDDILVREDRQWDFMLAQMRSSEQRESDWAKFRRGVDAMQRKKRFRSIGGRMI